MLGVSRKLSKVIVLPILLMVTAAILTVTLIAKDWSVLEKIFGKLDSLDIKKSKARLYLDGNNLKVEFEIGQENSKLIKTFSQNLGATDGWLDGLSLELDSPTVDKIKESLPIETWLNFEEKKVNFYSNLLPPLNSGLANKKFEFSTGSASLTLTAANLRDYHLLITDPKPLMVYATSSAIINMSPQMSTLFPLLSKIAIIEIKAQGQNIEGKVILK